MSDLNGQNRILGIDGRPAASQPCVVNPNEPPPPDPRLPEILKALSLICELQEFPGKAGVLGGWVPAAVFLVLERGSPQAQIAKTLPFVHLPPGWMEKAGT